MSQATISEFLKRHQLPEQYGSLIKTWYAPMIEKIKSHHKGAKHPLIIGVNGAQGSGKSTLGDLLVFWLQEQHKLHTVSLSIDDFYLTQQERQQLAETIHPLLATRGVPGTHDIDLAKQTIQQLLQNEFPVAIPRFNKAEDDRFPESEFDSVDSPVDIIVLEGWCLGSTPQDEDKLNTVVNDLEAEGDKDGIWRHYVNEQLSDNYPSLFELVDIWIMLKAPSFNCVYQWRLQQEDKLRKRNNNTGTKIMSADEVDRFIKFYQRITEQTLNTLPNKVHFLFELDQNREIMNLTELPLPQSMPQQVQHHWLVFTDMDGSLLDHHDYRFDDAIPTLSMLAQHDIPVIPVTSKTATEVELLRDNLENQHPFIVENGAAVYIPIGYFKQQPADTEVKGKYWVKSFVERRQHWQQMIEKIRPDYQNQFLTFADAGIDGIINLTGLNVHAAARAARREFGEPVSWHGNGNLKQAFIQALEQQGAQVLIGGRFMHVSGFCDKGKAMSWLTAIYQQNWPGSEISTLAAGDSQNDIAMLEEADFALIIRSPAHAVPELERRQQVTVSTLHGPKGWAEGVTQIIGATMSSDSFNQPRGNHG